MRELAERVGIHPQSLRNIELGKRSVSRATLGSVASSLGIPVTQITGISSDLAETKPDLNATVDESEPAPSYRLYTCLDGALRIGSGITASLLERLATEGFEHTRIAGKVRYTDAQLARVVAAHARGETITAPVASRRSAARAAAAVDLSAAPGRRYST